jgi:hypothetical protein
MYKDLQSNLGPGVVGCALPGTMLAGTLRLKTDNCNFEILSSGRRRGCQLTPIQRRLTSALDLETSHESLIPFAGRSLLLTPDLEWPPTEG